MDEYTKLAYETSQAFTKHYSTSFSKSIRLFDRQLRPHIYAIYGMVRAADEIVDTYQAADAAELLEEFRQHVYDAINRGYSPNPVLHSFAQTATRYGIDEELIDPFFKSMQLDTKPIKFDKKLYDQYIFGSAEVVGLMCLRVFTSGDDDQYQALQPGAQALGAAYQKVNFLRDMAADYAQLKRFYFPGTSFDSFDDAARSNIVADIRHDISVAKPYAHSLPTSCRRAVVLSLAYYEALLDTLEHTPPSTIKQTRVRISDGRKLQIYIRTSVLGRLRGK